MTRGLWVICSNSGTSISEMQTLIWALQLSIETKQDKRNRATLFKVSSISPPYSRHCCRLTNVGGRGPRLVDSRYQTDISYSTSL